jgi:hypothetical protein
MRPGLAAIKAFPAVVRVVMKVVESDPVASKAALTMGTMKVRPLMRRP